MIYNDAKNSIIAKLQKVNSFWLYFIPFVILSIPVLIMILTGNIPQVSGYYSLHYVLNYDHGFVARGLAGEVLSWFFDTMTERIINNCNMVFTEVFVLSVSLCIGKSLNKSREDPEKFFTVLFFILLLCVGEFTTGTYYSDIKMDKLIWAITFFAVYVSDNKFLNFLIPVFSIISIFMNPVFCFTGFVLIAVILADKFQKSSYSRQAGVFFIATCVLVVFITGFATIAQTHHNFKDANEFLDFYFARFDGELSKNLRDRFAEDWIFEYFAKSPQEIMDKTFNTYFMDWNRGAITVVATVFLAIPAIAVSSVFWSKVMKNEDDKFRKLIYLVCMVSYVPAVPAIVLSWEATKYYGGYLLVQLALIVYFLIQNDEAVTSVVKNYKDKIKTNPMVFASVAGYFITALMVK